MKKILIALFFFLVSCGEGEKQKNNKLINKIDGITAEIPPKECADSLMVGSWDEISRDDEEILNVAEDCYAENRYCNSEMKFFFKSDSSLLVDVISTDDQKNCLELGQHKCDYVLSNDDPDIFILFCDDLKLVYRKIFRP